MKMKVIFALCAFISIVAMENKQCKITFHNDLDVLATIKGFPVQPNQRLKSIVCTGKSIAVCTASERSLSVPIIKNGKKRTSCIVPLSFLIYAEEDSMYVAPGNKNILFYFCKR